MKNSTKNLFKRLIVLLAAMPICIFSLFACVNGAKAWFTNNTNVSANGASVTVEGPVSIAIRQSKTSENVGTIDINKDTTHIENYIDNDEDTIQPGSSGHFSFFAEYDDTKHDDSHTFTMSVKTVNNYFKNDNHGFFTNKVEREADKENSVTYINSHLLFFQDYSDGVYSNWVRSGSEFNVTCNETEDDYMAGVTIYWIWVQDFQDLFSNPTSKIDSTDIANISSYYSSDDHKAEMFDEGYVTEDSYNVADYIIGTTLQYICFELDVR